MKKKSIVVALSVLVFVAWGWTVFTDRSNKTVVEPRQISGVAEDVDPRFQVGPAEISVATDPPTPTVGSNTLIFRIWDENGDPASGVVIDAYAEMPAMGSMSAMRAAAGQLLETAPGRYEGEVELAMRGEWPLTVQIQEHPEFGSRRLQFDLATDRAGLSIASGGVLIGDGSAFDSGDNTFSIDARRRQLIGLKTAQATDRELTKSIRAVGRVNYDERSLSQVTLKYDGYIGTLKANYVGVEVKKGEELFTVYSPDIFAAQQEYIETINRGSSDSLNISARHRLVLWDMDEREIAELERRGAAQDYIPIYAQKSGIVVERNITDGSGVSAGQTLLTIADLSQVWVEADIYESDLELVTVGTPVVVSIPYLPNQRFESQVEYIYPYIQNETRTARLRLTLDNAAALLKPDMYAEVSLEISFGITLTVPEEAVIVAGTSRVVFVDLGGGYLKPVQVATGQRAQGYVEIFDGIDTGDVVVTSGNFLVAAEARLKTGLQQW